MCVPETKRSHQGSILHLGYKIPVEEDVEGPDPVRDGAGGACVGGFVGGRRDGAPHAN